MTIIIKQRKPDKDTLERHDYTKKDVEKAYTYLGADGIIYIKLEFENGRGEHYSTQFFDMEIQAAG